MKQGIIFDMDGTLWDSAENVAISWNIAIKKSGLIKKELTVDDIHSVMGKTWEGLADALFFELPKAERMQLVADCFQEENDYLRHRGGVLYPNLEETLKILREKYVLYIVSNCQQGYIEDFLAFYHFEEYFEDIECHGNNLNPKGENIRLIAERNGLDEAVYVGDIQGDYDASRQAGVGFIHAAYGFGTINEEVPVIKNLLELPEVVDKYFKR